MNKYFVKEAHFEHEGRDCIVVFSRMGFRCGYVSVDENDKDFVEVIRDFNGKKRTEIDYLAFDIDCHGGLTFGNELHHELEPKAKHYVGFDCAHFGDGIDKKQAIKYGFDTCYLFTAYESVRSKEYCIDECKSIVKQLNERRNKK